MLVKVVITYMDKIASKSSDIWRKVLVKEVISSTYMEKSASKRSNIKYIYGEKCW